MINGYTPHAAGSGTAGEVRELKQRRRRAGRVSQLQLLAQQPKLRGLKQRPKVRVLKQWADGRVRQMRVLAHMTKLRNSGRRRVGRVRELRLLEQQAHDYVNNQND